MFRIRPNGCTRRQMKRFGRSGHCLRKSRGDPPSLHLVDTKKRYIEFEEIEKLLINSIKKERKS
jgi:hypothetical protein